MGMIRPSIVDVESAAVELLYSSKIEPRLIIIGLTNAAADGCATTVCFALALIVGDIPRVATSVALLSRRRPHRDVHSSADRGTPHPYTG